MIRPAVCEDLAALCDLAFRSKAHWGYSAQFMDRCRAELRVEENDLRRDLVYVLEVGNKRVGFYALERISATRVELGHLFVDPEHIGLGYGTSLVDDAKSRAAQLGFDTLEIHSDPHAEAFYQGCGARTVGNKASASIPGRTLPLMELAL